MIDEASAHKLFRFERKGRYTIQYGYRTRGTHARVFFQTSLMGTARTKYDKEKDEDGKKQSFIYHGKLMRSKYYWNLQVRVSGKYVKL